MDSTKSFLWRSLGEMIPGVCGRPFFLFDAPSLHKLLLFLLFFLFCLQFILLFVCNLFYCLFAFVVINALARLSLGS